MHYRCKKCSYEFDAYIQPHPHPMGRPSLIGGYGCPVCLKAAAKSKVCPSCGSLDLEQSVNIKQ